MDRPIRVPFFSLFLITLFLFCAKGFAQRSMSHEEARALDHQNPVWNSIRSHLPDPNTSSAEKLESAADILRARRFLEDAMDYYSFALDHGGEAVHLLNKLGVTQLELRDFNSARNYFQRAVKTKKKSAESWNNLGAVEYLTGRYDIAISHYKRALKIDKTSATFHSNIGTAYFEKRDFDRSRKEYEIALKLNPSILREHGTLGTTTRMLSPEDHARYCFELARLYARQNDESDMLHYLTMASEAGFDILREMNSDAIFKEYRKDPRVLVIVQNSKELRNRNTNIAQGAAPPPPLPPEKH